MQERWIIGKHSKHPTDLIETSRRKLQLLHNSQDNLWIDIVRSHTDRSFKEEREKRTY